MNDTYRLEWIADNSAAIRKGGHASTPYYFVIYRNGSTSAADDDLRAAIDYAIAEKECDDNKAID